jgi:hypothetical protein
VKKLEWVTAFSKKSTAWVKLWQWPLWQRLVALQRGREATADGLVAEKEKQSPALGFIGRGDRKAGCTAFF